MNSEPLVSVIVPVYNVGKYIEEALSSLVNQTYQNLEILIIDDGSTDESGSICDKYAEADPRIKVFHQENAGVSAARNTGLDNISGGIVAFLDPDDVFMPDAIKSMVRKLIDENADIVMGRYYEIESKDSLTGAEGSSKKPRISAGEYDRKAALCAINERKINYAVWNKIFSRKLWENVRFPIGRCFEDVETAFSVFDRCEKLCVLDDLVYIYRIRPRSIMHTFDISHIKDRIASLEKRERFVSGHYPDIYNEKQLVNTRRNMMLIMIMLFCKYSKEKSIEWKSFRRSLRKDIIAFKIEKGMRKFGIKAKLLYLAVRFFPHLAPLIHAIYGYRSAD